MSVPRIRLVWQKSLDYFNNVGYEIESKSSKIVQNFATLVILLEKFNIVIFLDSYRTTSCSLKSTFIVAIHSKFLGKKNETKHFRYAFCY